MLGDKQKEQKSATEGMISRSGTRYNLDGLRYSNGIKPDTDVGQTQFSEEWISAPGRDKSLQVSEHDKRVGSSGRVGTHKSLFSKEAQRSVPDANLSDKMKAIQNRLSQMERVANELDKIYRDCTDDSIKKIILDVRQAYEKCPDDKKFEAMLAKSSEYNKQLEAMLMLSPEEKTVFEEFKKTYEGIQANKDNPKLYPQYILSTKKILKIVSPETLQEYERHGVEILVNPDPKAKYHSLKEIAQGHWQLHLPTNYPYTSAGIVLRTIEKALKLEQIPSPGRRAVVTARTLQANEIMGKTYGWDIENYELAKQHHRNSIKAIRQALIKGWITTDTTKEEIRTIGYNNALEGLLRLIRPTNGREDPDVVKIFPSVEPGAYFEYANEEKAVNGRIPVKMGTKEYEDMLKQMELRRQQGENYTLTKVIFPDKQVWAQPYYVSEDKLGRHAIISRGMPCAWAGETAEVDRKLKEMSDQSGHFRTSDEYVNTAMGKDVFSNFALSVHRANGYDISETKVELMAKVGPQDQEYFLQSSKEQAENSTDSVSSSKQKEDIS